MISALLLIIVSLCNELSNLTKYIFEADDGPLYIRLLDRKFKMCNTIYD